uniref:Uncharacterized protein n=1 Tax=Panagrolaimus sp. ES5 TaxID=591445 RepID=A0AC34G512_9BILA
MYLKADEVYENVKLVVSVADEGVYKVEFVNGKDKTIFPHYIQNDSSYKKAGKNIFFIARDNDMIRKSVTCEFQDAASAQKAFETLQECQEYTIFDGFDD